MADEAEKRKKTEAEINRIKGEQNSKENESVRLQTLLNNLSATYVDTIRETLGIQSKRTTFDSNLLKINKQINRSLLNSKSTFTSISQLGKNIADNQDVIFKGEKTAGALRQGIVDRGKKSLITSNKAIEAGKIVQELEEKRNRLLEEGKDLNEEDLKRLEQADTNLDRSLKLLAKRKDLSAQQYVFTSLNTEALSKQNKELAKIKESASGASFLSQLFGKIPGFGEASKESFSQLTEEIQTSSKFTGSIGGKFKSMGRYVVLLGKNLIRTLGPLGIIISLVKAIAKADEEVTNLAKSLTLTKREAVVFRTQMQTAANLSGDLFITSTKLVNTFNAINKQFGFITKFSKETLIGVTKLTEKVGIGAEAAGNLAIASERTGKSFESNYKDVLETSYALQRQTGVQLNLLEVVEDIGKVTGQTRALLQANPKLIAEAVTQAKFLGAELDDIVGASKTFLDFESSIRKELEAEVLLGRDLNLERARSASLQGDFATVAKEIAAQAGNFSQFTQLNVLEQQALADAVGITVDRLSDALLIREAQGRSAEELRAIGRDDLANRLEQTSASQKLQAVQEKLLSIATDLAVAFTPLVDTLAIVLDILKPIFVIVEGIFNFLNPALSGLSQLVNGALTIQHPLTKGISNSIKDGFQTGFDGINSQKLTSDVSKLSAGFSDKIVKDYQEEGIGSFFPKSDQMVTGVLGTIDLARDISDSEDIKNLLPTLNSTIESSQQSFMDMYQDNAMRIQGIREDYKYRNEGQFWGEFAKSMDSIGVKLDNVGIKIDKGNKQTSDIKLDSSTIATTTAKRAFNIQ